jgi:quercetin dioxygenase-like cupin family protein
MAGSDVHGEVPSDGRTTDHEGDGGKGENTPRSIANPITGVRITAVVGPEATGGEYTESEVHLAPGADGPDEHVHREFEERFEVVSGRVTFSVGGRERTLGPGADVWVSRGTAHAFRNDTDDPAEMRVRTVPPGEGGEILATLFGLAQDGRVDDEGQPDFLQTMVMAEADGGRTYFTDTPSPVQRALAEVFGPVGRALGYRATYERYLDAAFWEERVGRD